MRSLPRSMPCSFLNSSIIQSTMRWSMSSPPRCVSPLVDFTSTTPSPTSRIGNIERAAAEVVHGDGFVVLLVEAVSQSRRRRLVDDAQDFQAGNFARLLGGLALASLKYAGTVITALVTFSPRKSSAADFSFCRIIAEISGGL